MIELPAYLLTRGWRDVDGDLRLTLWATSEQGPVQVCVRRAEAVMFVDRGAPSRAPRRREVKLVSLHGRPVDALYFRSQRDLLRERDRLRAEHHMVYESDLKPVDRFLMERFIHAGVLVRGAARQRDGYLSFDDPELRPAEVAPRLKVMSLDIETEGFDGPILSVAAVVAPWSVEEGIGPRQRWSERVLMVGAGGPRVTACADERALLAAFYAHLREADPDVVIGWNLVEFDLSYLWQRGELLGVPFEVGRGGERATVLPAQHEGQLAMARIPGRAAVDGIGAMRSAAWSFESWSLEHVSRSLLGRGKHVDEATDRVAAVQRMYAEDRPALAAYNLEDCRLVLDVFEAADLLGFAAERQRLTGLPLGRVGGAVTAFDNVYLPRLHRRGRVALDVGWAPPTASSPGGYVLPSAPGLYHNVLVLDFKSLYPSIIRTFKIDPLGLAAAGEDAIAGFDGASFSRDEHILPELIASLWSERDRAKARDDAAMSRALKILMNSFYGVLAAPGCRFFNARLASSITRRGHEIITRSRDFIERTGRRVIYGDTDSLFVLLGEGPDPAACRAMGVELAAAVSAFWRDELRARARLDSHLELQMERHYARFVMPTLRGSERGSAKRYAGLLVDAPGPRVVFKGLEAVRSDWTPLARRLQRELYTRVLTDRPYEAFLRETTAALLAGRLDGELVYRRRLRRDMEAYTRNVPPHVQAARKLARPGRQVAYVITVRGPEPVQHHTSPLDHQHYLHKQLAPAADTLLSLLGTSFVTVAGPQLELF